MSIIREKRHRLPLDAYIGFVRASFTLTLHNRASYFSTIENFRIHEAHLLRALNDPHCSADLYLFMPDHLHIIVTGTRDEADTRYAMVKFKQYSGYWFSKNQPDIRWQKDFYDHILRPGEDPKKQMFYILHNPTRAGLCERWEQYPFIGSTVYDLKAWANDLPLL